jgi:tRNA pseudouridine55 synthase
VSIPRALRPVGIALVDKPAGPSSFAIVATLRRRTRARTGHAGTLDPFATGLLVLLSGAATRLVPCFVGLDKRYVTDVDLTSTTTTGDPEGDVVERHAPPSRAALDEALARLRGEIELPVPAASAVKIGGERAYRLARRGVEIDMPLRRSQVHALDVIAYTGDSSAGETTTAVAAGAVAAVRLDLRVSSGTYIRSIADALGGHCTTLRRLTVGDFGVDEAAPVEEAALLSVGAALERLPPEAREKVSESVRAGVLALDAPVGDGSAA